MDENYNQLRWQLCKKCMEESTLAQYESGTETGYGNADTIPFEPSRFLQDGIDNDYRWRNPAVTVRANQPMFGTNYQLCKVCPYEMEHWLFYETIESEKNKV